MNHLNLMLAGFSAASTPLLADSAIKGTALLFLASLAALLLRRDSAARRHLIWLLAIAALLATPILAALLPQWRVLPHWTDLSPKATAFVSNPPSINLPPTSPIESPQPATPAETQPPPATISAPTSAKVTISKPVLQPPRKPAAPAPTTWTWNRVLPLLWAIGFSILILRLLAARLLLQNSQQRTTAPDDAKDTPISAALAAARLQLNVRQPITLLFHPDNIIPVVFGIFKPRLLLPQSARDWTRDQLNSVLLHELAHVKRRDMLIQLLTQIACGLHWFNPLAWLAAWRLGVERERACDDLVLASGVRPSTYATHLLDAITTLSPARWTHACGLAMARQSSLEGRLLAVLSKNQSRRRVSLTLAIIALALAAVIAVPVAMLRAADSKPAIDAKPATADQAKPAPEQNLNWGKPVNGLRAAMALRPFSDQPKAGDIPELYIAVQNVSDAPIRLNDSLAEKQPRMLVLFIDRRIVAGIGAKDPRLGDRLLKPQEITYVQMYNAGDRADKKTIGQLMAEDIIKDTHQSMVAHLLIEKAPQAAWSGELITAETTGAVAAGQPQPNNKEAQALMATWQHHARLNGTFPGGHIELLGEKMKEFIRNNTNDAAGDPYAKKMAPLLERIDSSRDQKPADVAALFDTIAAVTPVPLETTLDQINQQTIKGGAPLPPKLARAPWGQANATGLRTAYLLEPVAAEHSLGTPLNARILIHNAGKNTVVFRTRSWHQLGHTATDANGKAIKIESTDWLTRGILTVFRLNPGEYIELNTPGIGVGAMKGPGNWQNTRVGSWIEAKPGDDATVTTSPLPLKDWNEPAPKADEQPAWWLDLITAKLNQDQPIPADPEERQRIVYRAGMELFGTPLDAKTLDSFVSDKEPGAVERLAQRLATREGIKIFSGDLTPAPTTFKVLPFDPNAKPIPAPPEPQPIRKGAPASPAR